jgi:hypothetical protein
MRIKLTADIDKSSENNCVTGNEYEAVLIHPYSTTVEFICESGKAIRAFHYEYETVEVAE